MRVELHVMLASPFLFSAWNVNYSSIPSITSVSFSQQGCSDFHVVLSLERMHDQGFVHLWKLMNEMQYAEC